MVLNKLPEYFCNKMWKNNAQWFKEQRES